MQSNTMEPSKETSFETLAEKFLGKGFPRHLFGTISLSEMSPDVQKFALRLLDLMKHSGYSITQFNPLLIRWLSSTIPNILPGAWGGHIPPITVSGRHRKFDDYIAGHTFPATTGKNIFLDVGCGFPPVTTADTARRFPDWQIYGVDHSLADYVLYDSKGHYACFSQEGEFLYFQASIGSSAKTLYAAPKLTKNRFKQLFTDLFPLLRNIDSQYPETVEKDGNKLIRNHIMNFETDNLRFIRSDIMDLRPMAAKVCRCMNLFLYFPFNVKKEKLLHIKEHLEHNGLLIIGTNGFDTQSRYIVFQKELSYLKDKEFAFSLDNLGHISLMPWFTIHDNDPEAMLLAELAKTIRSTHSFWEPFSIFQDQLLEYHGLCQRKYDGFLHFPTDEILPGKFLKKSALLWQEMQDKGFLKGAVEVLNKAGYEAWINPADDIAIRPPAGTFFKA